MNSKDYTEIAEQLFNLVDNDKDKVNDFYSHLNSQSPDIKQDLQHWFANFVNNQELSDLFKKGETETGFINWIVSNQGENYFNNTVREYSMENINNPQTVSVRDMTSDKTQIHLDIEDEDDEIMSNNEKRILSDMVDGDYESSDIDNEDEIEMALDLMDDGSDDVDIVFDITGSEDDVEEGSDEEPEECEHKRKIFLDHHINKVVETIDDEEEVDRFTHKKYYVMKKEELVTSDRMNELEDELDKQNISYYDFGKNETIAIKIYCQNEVKINRIFEKLNFDCRCVDIAHYTDDWYSKK